MNVQTKSPKEMLIAELENMTEDRIIKILEANCSWLPNAQNMWVNNPITRLAQGVVDELWNAPAEDEAWQHL